MPMAALPDMAAPSGQQLAASSAPEIPREAVTRTTSMVSIDNDPAKPAQRKVLASFVASVE